MLPKRCQSIRKLALSQVVTWKSLVLVLFPLDVVYTETYPKVLVFDDNRNSLYTNYLYYLYYQRFLLSKPAVNNFLTAKS